jgi:arsenate reductase (glutaredoxin)
MNIQINGHKKSKDTRKAERFFSERNVPFHSRDIIEKPLSPGEIENICRSIDPESLIDTESNAYKKGGFAFMVYDPIEEISEKPHLIRIPIVRNGNVSTVGYEPDIWAGWIESDRG